MSGATSIPPDGIIRINSQLADLLNSMAAATPTTEPVAPGVVWRDNGVLTVSVGIPPVITLQPQSQSVDVGDPVTFTIAATNATSYQWRRDGSNISGATSTSYTIGETVEVDDAAEFDCVVTGPGGTVTSNVATLTVVSIPVITSQPTNQTINSGSTATISVTATGATSYQVQRLIDAVWTDVIGATSSSYTTPTLTYDEGDGYQYRFVVTGPGGSVNSNAATITVLLVADRYISPTGNDSADGLTRDTAWGTFTKLSADVTALSSSGTRSYVILSGNYTLKGEINFAVSNRTLLFDYEEDVIVDTVAATVVNSGFNINDGLGSCIVNLRGAEFYGNNIGSANGIGTNNTFANLVFNGIRADGKKAIFDGYDDGLSCHGNGSAVGAIVFNDIIARNCPKAAVIHVNSASATHNRCEFIGKTGAILGIGGSQASVASFWNDCDFVPAVDLGNGVSYQGNTNKSRIGSITKRLLGANWAFGTGTLSDTRRDNFIAHHQGDGPGVLRLTRNFGFFNNMRIRGPITQAAMFENCIFTGWNTSQDFIVGTFDGGGGNWLGGTPIFRNCVFIGFRTVFGFVNTTQRDHMNAHWTVENCCFWDNTTNFQSGLTIGTNLVLADPLLGSRATTNQADWAVGVGSPCIGAGTSGGNIGFTLADIS
jgi:hypothetical protein